MDFHIKPHQPVEYINLEYEIDKGYCSITPECLAENKNENSTKIR